MKREQNISENLEQTAPSLSKITKENHFSIPENYFESLPEITTNKMLDNNPIKNIFDKMSWRILIPFTAVVIIFTVITNLNNVNENEILTYDQLSEYIITEEDIEFDAYLVYDAYAETIEIEEEFNAETDEYINYLMENDIDISSIIETL